MLHSPHQLATNSRTTSPTSDSLSTVSFRSVESLATDIKVSSSTDSTLSLFSSLSGEFRWLLLLLGKTKLLLELWMALDFGLMAGEDNCLQQHSEILRKLLSIA